MTCEVCGDAGVRTICYACGMPVCKEDSEIVERYRSYGRVRICEPCMELHAGHFTRYPAWREENDHRYPHRSEYEKKPESGTSDHAIPHDIAESGA